MALAGSLLLLFALPVSGQSVVAGTVLDAQSGEPVGGARIVLLDSDADPVRTTDADDAGAFVISTEPGSYRIRVERLGYPTHTTDAITVAERDRVEIEILLHPQAIGLDSLVIVGRRTETGREAFERRRDAAERGTFLDPVHVALLEPAMPSDLLRRIPDLVVTHLDDIQHVLRRRCLSIFVDEMNAPIMRHPRSERAAMGGNVHLNEFVSARSVRAVEIYPTIADVPREIRRSRRWPYNRSM